MSTTTIETETVEIRTAYSVPVQHIASLSEKVAAMNKKATKLGCEPVVMTLGAIEVRPTIVEFTFDGERDSRTVNIAYQEVTIIGQAPKIAGYSFVATLEHTEAGNIVRVVPGLEIDTTAYRSVAPNCEHCGKLRNRKDTYLVVSEAGQLVQVGSACIGDFLGSTSPQSLAGYAEIIRALDEAASEHAGRCAAPVYDTVEFLSHVAASIREDGWISRSEAINGYGKTATASAAWESMTISPANKNYDKLHYTVTEDDKARAEAALAWVRVMETSNDYTYNLQVACAPEFLNERAIGLVASAISAHDRAMQRETERKQAEAGISYTPGFIGAEGDKVEVEVTVTREIEISGYYGITYLYTMIATDGHWVKWFSSNQALKAGESYKLRGTVKGHDTREGKDSTTLTRCKVS